MFCSFSVRYLHQGKVAFLGGDPCRTSAALARGPASPLRRRQTVQGLGFGLWVIPATDFYEWKAVQRGSQASLSPQASGRIMYPNIRLAEHTLAAM